MRSPEERSIEKSIQTRDVASGLAAMFLQENLENGAIIEIPSLGIKVSKVAALEPQDASSIFDAAHVITDIFSGERTFFHYGPVSSSGEPRELHITVEPEKREFSQLRPQSYIAVGEEGTVSHMHETDEEITVTNGKLVVMQEDSMNEVCVEQVLVKDEEFIIPAGIIHSHRSKENYAVFHTNQEVSQGVNLSSKESAE
jgi:hypothetical protein